MRLASASRLLRISLRSVSLRHLTPAFAPGIAVIAFMTIDPLPLTATFIHRRSGYPAGRVRHDLVCRIRARSSGTRSGINQES